MVPEVTISVGFSARNLRENNVVYRLLRFSCDFLRESNFNFRIPRRAFKPTAISFKHLLYSISITLYNDYTPDPSNRILRTFAKQFPPQVTII